MDWITLVLPRVKTWGPHTWNAPTTGIFVPGGLTISSSALQGSLEAINSTSQGNALIETAITNHTHLRFAGTTIGSRVVSGIGVDTYVLLDLTDPVYFVNTYGKVVEQSLTGLIAHELAHLAGLDNTVDWESPSETLLNSATYDYQGDAVDAENAIVTATVSGQNMRSSYMATWQASTAVTSYLPLGSEWTQGKQIDITRFGTDAANRQDMTQRGDNSRDLIFGFSGNDEIYGGGGDDFLYGGIGNDKLVGGDGYDYLDGGEDDDIIYLGVGDTAKGGAGNDKFYTFTNLMVQLVNDGVVLPGGDDPKYQDTTKWFLFDSMTNVDDVWLVDDRWAIPIVTILDFESGDELYVDGKLISGKQIIYEEGALVSSSFSWMTPIGSLDHVWPYHETLWDQWDTVQYRQIHEDYQNGDAEYNSDDMAEYEDYLEFFDRVHTATSNADGWTSNFDTVFTAGLLIAVPGAYGTAPFVDDIII